MQDVRNDNYEKVSFSIEKITNIKEVLESGEVAHEGIGGTAVKLEIAGIPVFAKQIPITNLEMQNLYFTKNLFNLPIYYQYGVGSTGFGVWRELAIHQKTTDWVLKKECENFPIMYGYKIIEQKNPQQIDEENLKKYVQYWGSSQEIRDKMQALNDAKHSLVIFMEYIPNTLHKYVKEEENIDLKMVEENLKSTVNFMKNKGMIHFDGHGKNILTEGERLYFADFGLATSRDFDLSKEEQEFLNINKEYDLALGIDAICNALEQSKDTQDKADFLEKYSKISETYHSFFMKLREDETKSVQYPQHTILTMLENIENEELQSIYKNSKELIM